METNAENTNAEKRLISLEPDWAHIEKMMGSFQWCLPEAKGFFDVVIAPSLKAETAAAVRDEVVSWLFLLVGHGICLRDFRAWRIDATEKRKASIQAMRIGAGKDSPLSEQARGALKAALRHI